MQFLVKIWHCRLNTLLKHKYMDNIYKYKLREVPYEFIFTRKPHNRPL